jgi:uncharacterized protein (TIGR03435 family)
MITRLIATAALTVSLSMAPGFARTSAELLPPDSTTAIRQELGLKLEKTKAPAEVLVVEHVEKPNAN